MTAVRRLLHLAAWAVFLCLATGYEDVEVSDYEGAEVSGSAEEPLLMARELRSGGAAGEPAADSRWTLGLGKRPAQFSPYLSVGVLSNMQHFFENLRNNLESLETLPAEEKDALLGRNMPSADNDRSMRPRATAAYLHALRNHRPSHKIRSFVAAPEPAGLRNSNMHDPNYLWTGLGRR